MLSVWATYLAEAGSGVGLPSAMGHLAVLVIGLTSSHSVAYLRIWLWQALMSIRAGFAGDLNSGNFLGGVI